jgi:DNA adenine methylase
VNFKGQFNVPKGSKERVVFDYDNFEEIARALQAVTLLHCDFELSINQTGAGDFLFVDPPYTVKHNSNGFVKYNERLFGWHDQIRLRDCVVAAAERGADVIVTNADHASIRTLYRGVANIRTVKRSSVLSGDSRFRGEVTEVVITLPKKSRERKSLVGLEKKHSTRV